VCSRSRREACWKIRLRGAGPEGAARAPGDARARRARTSGLVRCSLGAGLGADLGVGARSTAWAGWSPRTPGSCSRPSRACTPRWGSTGLQDPVFADLVIARVVEQASLLDAARVLSDLDRAPASLCISRLLDRLLTGICGIVAVWYFADQIMPSFRCCWEKDQVLSRRQMATYHSVWSSAASSSS
jgi:hypothetical protein